MTFLQIYLYANISILFFWMFYRIFLRNVKHFQAGRFYILSALPGSLAIPFLQNGISGFIKSHETIVNSSLYNFIYLTTTNGYSGEQILNPIFSIDFLSVVKTFILIGAIASSAWIILSHIRINQLIKKSRLLNSE